MTVDTEIALERNTLRYLKTGRYVPDEIVSGTHAAISEVLPEAIRRGLYDELRVWDTNISGKVRLIAEIKNGKLKILDKKLWKRFLDKGKPSKPKVKKPKPKKPDDPKPKKPDDPSDHTLPAPAKEAMDAYERELLKYLEVTPDDIAFFESVKQK